MIRELGKGSSFATPACGRRRGWRSRSRCAHGSPRASAEDAGRARSVARHLFVSPAGGHLRSCGCLSAQRPDIADLTLPRHPAWAPPNASVPDEAGRVPSCGRVGQMVGAWGPGSPGHRPQESGGRERVSAAVDQPHSQAAVRAGWTGCDGVCRTWPEIGVLNGGCAPEHPVALDDATAAAARCSRCLATKVKPIRDA